jgi:hypothetical protein
MLRRVQHIAILMFRFREVEGPYMQTFGIEVVQKAYRENPRIPLAGLLARRDLSNSGVFDPLAPPDIDAL